MAADGARQRAGEMPIPQFLESGWDYLDEGAQAKIAALRKVGAEEAEDLAQLFRRVFDTPDGKAIMEELHRIAYFHPGFDASLGMDMATALGIEQNGMKKLIHFIQYQVHRAIEGS